MTPEQLNYVKEQLASGVAKDELKEVLKKTGYTDESINQLIEAATKAEEVVVPATPVPVVDQPAEQKSVKKKPSKLFIIILSIIGFIVAVFIGLALTVSSSLDSTRQSAADAIIKQSLSSVRSQAELYYLESSFSYAEVCDSPQVVEILTSLSSEVDCTDTEMGYRLISELSDGSYYCVVSLNEEGGGFIADAVTIGDYPTGSFCE